MFSPFIFPTDSMRKKNVALNMLGHSTSDKCVLQYFLGASLADSLCVDMS